MYIKERPKKEKKNISFVLFMYWAVIILWQTIRPVENRSLLDTAVKIVVFFAVVVYAYTNRKTNFGGYFVPLFLLFIATQMCTFYFDSGNGLTTGNVITVLFMLIEIYVFFGWCYDAQIKVNDLVWYCQWLCRCGVIMCVYNMIFSWNRFSLVFSLSTGAYNYECSSFLYSNHEFAFYLSAALISVVWLLFSKRMKWYTALILSVLYFVNLLSTYSRTAIFGVFGAVLILLFFYKKRLFMWISSVSVVALTFIVSNPFLYTLIFVKIFKGSFVEEGVLDEGRQVMYEMEWQSFLQGNWIRKIFGYGYAGANRFSGHDAYLTILLTGGIIMLLWFAFMIFVGFAASYKCLKYDKSVGSLLFGFQALSLLYMVAQTPILFYSSMDSFFITTISVLLPFYVANGYKSAEKGEKEIGLI